MQFMTTMESSSIPTQLQAIEKFIAQQPRNERLLSGHKLYSLDWIDSVGEDRGLGCCYRIMSRTTDYFVKLQITVYYIQARTEKGFWLDLGSWSEQYQADRTEGKPVKERFVLAEGQKRYACESLDDAFTSFNRRKERQYAILKAQLARAEDGLAASKAMAHALKQAKLL